MRTKQFPPGTPSRHRTPPILPAPIREATHPIALPYRYPIVKSEPMTEKEKLCFDYLNDKNVFFSSSPRYDLSLIDRVSKWIIDMGISRAGEFLVCYCPFSGYRMCNYLDRHAIVHKATPLISITTTDKRARITPRMASYKLSDNVFLIEYSEEYLSDRESFRFFVFCNWTRETVVNFILDFSKTLHGIDKEASEKNRDLHAFDRVFLPQSIISNFRKDMDVFLASKDIYTHELGLPWKQGYMFIGPPGVGKTLLIRSACKYYGLPWLDMKQAIQRDGSIEMDGKADGIDELLYPLETPTIYVLEDIDKFTTFQTNKDNEDSGSVSLHSLLKGIDGVEQPSGVIIMATTNHPGTLAEALMNRPGRFDRIYTMNHPERPEIAAFLNYHGLDFGKDLEKVLDGFKGYSMAFVEDFIKSLKTELKKKTFTYGEVKSVLDRIHEHNTLYKKHFKTDDSKFGFGR